jgi:hypothetical protein
MKRIDITKMLKDNYLDNEERKEILGMEFIKMGDKFLIKNSNGVIVDEKEKLKLENNEMVIKDVESNLCQKETTKKISNNKKRIKELNDKPIEETTTTE